MGRHSQPTTRRSKGTHRKPSPVTEMGQAAVTGLGATAVLGGVVAGFAPSASAATSNDFYRLRVCESSDNYADNTGNGFYGAYQFDLSTWHSNGFSGRPDQASPATQDQAAQLLYSRRGWEPWPDCSRRLGLVDDRASRSATRRPLVGPTAPPFDARVLTTAMSSQRREDVYQWQAQMARRGWPISVDGYYGPQTARVAHDFAVEKGIKHVLLGQVDHKVWAAAWIDPIT